MSTRVIISGEGVYTNPKLESDSSTLYISFSVGEPQKLSLHTYRSPYSSDAISLRISLINNKSSYIDTKIQQGRGITKYKINFVVSHIIRTFVL
jgi:hypothetical protein